MRSHLSADWAFGIRGAIESVVRRSFSGQLRQWPLLHTFDFEAYQVGTSYFVMVLRDKLSGVPAGPGELKPFPYSDHPDLPVTSYNVADWTAYLWQRFSLRPEDVAMILPIHDSGRNDSGTDFDLFTPEEKALWEYQLQLAIMRQQGSIQTPVQAEPQSPANIIYNVYGTNARVNVSSIDSSVNVVNASEPPVFQQLIEAIRQVDADPKIVTEVVTAVEEMRHSHGKDTFIQRYQSFMSVLADHMEIFGSVVAPYLPMLAQILT